MGLDAVVYKNAKYVFAPSEEEHLVIDLHTGEVYFAFDYTTETKLNAEFLHRRLGNVSLISMFRDIIREQMGERSLLYTKIVYSGSHSGDTIKVDEIPLLLSEISTIMRIGSSVGSLPEEEELFTQFLQSIELLCKAALEQDNPIVFE